MPGVHRKNHPRKPKHKNNTDPLELARQQRHPFAQIKPSFWQDLKDQLKAKADNVHPKFWKAHTGKRKQGENTLNLLPRILKSLGERQIQNDEATGLHALINSFISNPHIYNSQEEVPANSCNGKVDETLLNLYHYLSGLSLLYEYQFYQDQGLEDGLLSNHALSMKTAMLSQNNHALCVQKAPPANFQHIARILEFRSLFINNYCKASYIYDGLQFLSQIKSLHQSKYSKLLSGWKELLKNIKTLIENDSNKTIAIQLNQVINLTSGCGELLCEHSQELFKTSTEHAASLVEYTAYLEEIELPAKIEENQYHHLLYLDSIAKAAKRNYEACNNCLEHLTNFMTNILETHEKLGITVDETDLPRFCFP